MFPMCSYLFGNFVQWHLQKMRWQYNDALFIAHTALQRILTNIIKDIVFGYVNKLEFQAFQAVHA